MQVGLPLPNISSTVPAQMLVIGSLTVEGTLTLISPLIFQKDASQSTLFQEVFLEAGDTNNTTSIVSPMEVTHLHKNPTVNLVAPQLFYANGSTLVWDLDQFTLHPDLWPWYRYPW